MPKEVWSGEQLLHTALAEAGEVGEFKRRNNGGSRMQQRNKLMSYHPGKSLESLAIKFWDKALFE